MKAARLVVLGVAVVAGGVAAYLASGGPKPPTEAPKAAAPPLETLDVLVAKSDLARGQLIDASSIAWQTWPKSSVNGNFITKTARPDAINQFVGAVVRVPLAAGQPIFDPMVVFTKGATFMTAILPKGMRAVAMDVSPDAEAGGFILPEDHVDVLLTRHDKAAEKVSGIEKLITETILRNVRVLAVDQSVEEKNGEKSVIAKTVTLEVTPSQAEQLAQSRQVGTLSLALRSLFDSQSSTPEGGAEAAKQISTVRYGVSSMATVAR